MCYQCFILGAQLRADCVNLSMMACCDYFLCEKAENKPLYDEKAKQYLAPVLKALEYHGAKFVPIKVEGDGNCLVHSISRSIGGTEHLYSVLRAALTTELIDHEDFYRRATDGFYHHDGDGNYAEQIKWARPTSRAGQWMSPLHIFGLSNVLKRPIILLDGRLNPEPGSNGRGLYLPTRFTPDQCKAATTTGHSPSPIVISWSSGALNHYVCLAHLLDEVNEERPIGRFSNCVLPAGIVRACRAMRSVLPLALRSTALVGLQQVLKECQQLTPPKLRLNVNEGVHCLNLKWANVKGVHDFLREVGFVQSFDTEEPAKEPKPCKANIFGGTATRVLIAFKEIIYKDEADDNRADDMEAMKQMIEKGESAATSEFEILMQHKQGVQCFMDGIHRLSEAFTTHPNDVCIKKECTAVLETLRFLFRSKILSDGIVAMYNGHSANNGHSASSPVKVCIGMLQRFNRDKTGRKNVSLGGVLNTYQLLSNLLSFDANNIYQEATLQHLNIVLSETETFLTKLNEENGTPLCNFNHAKMKTKEKYKLIAKSISDLLYNCGVIAFQQRQNASTQADQIRLEYQTKLNASNTTNETQLKDIVTKLQHEEKSEQLIQEMARVVELQKTATQNIIQAMHAKVYAIDHAMYHLCISMMHVCSIFLNKTNNIDVVEKTYEQVDNDVMQSIYTVLYGDSRRAGVLVHASKYKTNVVKELLKRKGNGVAQKVLVECCVDPGDRYEQIQEHKQESKNQTILSADESNVPKQMMLHMPVVDSVLINTMITLLEDEIKVASTCCRNCQNPSCGKRIEASHEMIVSGNTLTCPACSTKQHITMNEFETYQMAQSITMKTTSGCAISFQKDRELFTNVWFADALMIESKNSTPPPETNATTNTTNQTNNKKEQKDHEEQDITTNTHSSCSASSSPPKLLRSRSNEMMDDIWDRARKYGSENEWSFASGQGPNFFQRGTLEDTKRHFRVLTSGLDLSTVISKDTEAMYKYKCQDCKHLNGAPCDIATFLAANQMPQCANCGSSNLIQMPTVCTYQDTIMAVVNGTLNENDVWTCPGCNTENKAIHAWCQSCEFSRSLDSIMPTESKKETE